EPAAAPIAADGGPAATATPAAAAAAPSPTEPAATPAPAAPPAPADASPRRLESQTHKWEFGIAVRAVGGPCIGLMGTFPVPAEWPEQQVKVVNEQITPTVQRHAYRTIEGLKQMTFEVPQLPGGSSAECFITFEITRQAQAAPRNTDNLLIPK